MKRKEIQDEKDAQTREDERQTAEHPVVRVVALRGFIYLGKPVEVGTTVDDVPEGVAAELVALNKARIVKPD
jgi:hypothetical protein